MGNLKQYFVTDVIYHLGELKIDLQRQKIDNNRSELLVRGIDRSIEKLDLIELLIKSYDNSNFKNLTNNINALFLRDPELHQICVMIRKLKNGENFNQLKTAHLIFQV